MVRIAIMRSASISQAKDGLSSLVDRVKAGEVVLITDRGVPVARLEPITTSTDNSGRMERLHRAGLARPASRTLPREFLEGPTVGSPEGTSAVDEVIAERRSGW
jgi:prevent-host-death family protein